MPSCCVVPLCSSRSGGHRFPKDSQLRKKWLVAIRRDNFTPTAYSRICKKHFLESDYIMPLESFCENPTAMLRKGSVPSQFSWTKPANSAIVNRRERAQKRRLLMDNQSTQKQCGSTDYSTQTMEIEDCSGTEISVAEVTVECSHKDVSTQCESEIEKFDKSTNTICKDKLQFSIEYLQDVKKQKFKFYTGFEDFEHFWCIFSMLGPAVDHLIYYPSNKVPQVSVSRILTPVNEFLLTIIKLRRNMPNKALAFKFNISETSVSRIFITWINFLYCQLKELDIWVPKDIAQTNMQIKGRQCSSTVIVDCTEIKIEKPKNPVAQQLTYSTYKSTNTLKVLIGISSVGMVTFISDAYGGSISDRALFEKCGLSKFLNKNDIILVDKGFQIQDLVAHKDVTVNIPGFLKKGSSQLEPHQLRLSKITSSKRIHVERIIGLAKTYRIINDTLTLNLVPLASRIIFVCFMLVNLRPNIMEGNK